jgi:putative acetyltransferase
MEQYFDIQSIPKKERDVQLLNNLINIWESSVRATHIFLAETDIQNLIPIVTNAIIEIDELFVAVGLNNRYTAFMGIADTKLEMLFVDAECRGNGLGGRLLSYAIAELQIKYVDVNEQNTQAAGFYRKYGFEVSSRSATDDFGNPFPILHLIKQTNDDSFFSHIRASLL